MDSYLDIAHRVLAASRRPMSAKGILNAAFRAHIVPDHLKGKTQHKTLQARLSEDILHHRATSLFYRTEPGHFFLCELISDPGIPEKFKEPFPARRRTRDLQKDSPLAIDRNFLASALGNQKNEVFQELLLSAEKCDAVKYLHSYNDKDFATVWTFSLVRRGHQALSYRVGRYRDNRESFANKRTVGFPGALSFVDRTLFSQTDYGASDNALSVLLLDLDLSAQSFSDGDLKKPEPKFVFEAEGDDGESILLVVLEWACPDWFEPTTRRLSLNDPCWLDIDVCPNNLDDFEPWSQETIGRLLRIGAGD